MRSEGALSRFLSEGLLPLVIWGLVAALVLHLIEIRGAFVTGGETRLRIAALAFALGAVLVRRLVYQEGRSSAAAYSATFLALITVFSAQMASLYPAPGTSATTVFLLDETIFLALWFATGSIVRACSADSEAALRAGEAGIAASVRLRARRRRERSRSAEARASREKAREKLWEERPPAGHPARPLLFFSLVAVPLFGAGLHMFAPDDGARLRMGMLLFLYLWSALVLLFLASLAQMRAYFQTRDVSLPEQVGLPWMGVGAILATTAVVLAFLLPQPPSLATAEVRAGVRAVYRGFESERWGIRDKALSRSESAREAPGGSGVAAEGSGAGSSGTGEGAGGGSDPSDAPLGQAPGAEARKNANRATVDRLREDHLSDAYRKQAIQQLDANKTRMSASAYEAFRRGFEIFLKIVIGIAGFAAVVMTLAALMALARGFRDSVSGFGAVGRGRRLERSVAPATARRARSFEAFLDPSLAGALRPRPGETEGDALARHVWNALLALCSDRGAPCPPDRTPREFVEAAPAPLAGFEAQARHLAEIYTMAEFSGRPLPEEHVPHLKELWRRLVKHAGESRA